MKLFSILALYCGATLACLTLDVFATPVWAQGTPDFDVSRIEEGATFEYETSEGHLIVYARGQRGKNYFFRVTEQVDSGRVILTETGVNEFSALVWRRFVGTAIGTTRYAPHDCSFVIDSCEFEVFERGSLTASVSITTEFTEEIWIRDAETSFENGQTKTTNQCGIYDQNSMVLVLFSFSSDGSRYWQKITSGPIANMADSMLDHVRDVCLRKMIIS